MIHTQTHDNVLCVFCNGQLIYTRWLKYNFGMVSCPVFGNFVPHRKLGGLTKAKRRKAYLYAAKAIFNEVCEGSCHALFLSLKSDDVLQEDYFDMDVFIEMLLFKPAINEGRCFWWESSNIGKLTRTTALLLAAEITKS